MTQEKTNSCIQIFFILIFSAIALSGCMQPADNPKTIADRYWQFIQAGNTVEAEKLISVNSRRVYSENNHRSAAIEQFSNDEVVTIISTSITTISPHNNFTRTQTFDTYLVLQQGQWKIDANRTQMPPAPSATEEELQVLAEELSESMQDNIESIDETMNQSMQMLNEALRDGSKEMGDSLLQLMNGLNKSMRDSIDKMKQRRQEQLQEQESQPNQPDPDKGEGMI